MRPCRSLAVPLICLALFTVGAAQEKTSQKIEGWGLFIDPAGDCKVSKEKGRVILTEHNLNPTPEFDNVLRPRVLQELEGDFELQVAVQAFARPKAKTSSTKQGNSYVAAGLLIWKDEKTFIRCLRAANGERGDLFYHVEVFQDGKKLLTGKFLAKTRILPDRTTTLKVERRADEFTISYSNNGKDWVRFFQLNDLTLPKKLQAGVAVVNSTKKEFSAQFEELKSSKN